MLRINGEYAPVGGIPERGDRVVVGLKLVVQSLAADVARFQIVNGDVDVAFPLWIVPAVSDRTDKKFVANDDCSFILKPP